MSPADLTTVLIPAAGRVPEGLLALSNITNPALIPVAGRPVIHWTMSYLKGLGLTKFVIAVARRGGFIEDFVQCAFGATCEVEFITPSATGGLGQTVADLAAKVTTPRALVVLGDTHFQFHDAAVLQSPSPTVLVSPVEESYRWCVAEAGADGQVTALRDKEPGLTGPVQALIGVYAFPDALALQRASKEALAAATQAGKSAEMKAILERVGPLRAVPAKAWLDCGNADRQAAAHQTLLQQRAFNSLQVDPVLGTITKRSRNVDKFLDEVRYLQSVPKALQVLFPRVLDASTERGSAHVTLEYYGYPSLAEAFVYENVDPGVWQRIFEHLRQVLSRFAAHPHALPAGAVTAMTLGKTRERLEKLSGPPELVALVKREGEIELDGRPVRGLASRWSELEAAVARLEATAQGAVIHGDLCFSNILYDLRSRIVKLIDPRGSFGAPGPWGDPRYDVAKLFHSVHGLYDFLTNDLFVVKATERSLSLELRARSNHDALRKRFEQVFFEGPGAYVKKDVLLFTALLFASMLPLHDDAPRRQLAMYATALRLLDEHDHA